MLGWDGFYTVNPGSVLALVVLRHPPYREKAGRSGFRQQLLKFVDGLDIAMLTGSKDALLESVHVLLKLRQGSLCQLSLAGSGCGLFLGAFVSDIRLVPLSSRSSSPRQRILWLSQRHWLLGESCSPGLAGGSLLIVSTNDESRL